MAYISEVTIGYESMIAERAARDARALENLGEAFDRTGAAVEQTDAKITRSTRTASSLVRQFDPASKALNQMEAAMKRAASQMAILDRGLAKGEITADQHASAIKGITTQVDRYKSEVERVASSTSSLNAGLAEGASAAKLSSQQIGILAGEVHKFADQVIAGGGAMKAAFYQVPGMITVMGGLGNAMRIVGGIMTGPLGLAVGALGVGAALYKMGSAAQEEDTRLASLGQTLRATRTDYQSMAEAAEAASRRIAAKGGISLSDSRAATGTFATIPTISGSSLDTLAQTARNLAKVMGKEIPDAAKDMAGAFADPARAAEDFAQKGLLGIHEGLVQQVRDMQNSGDRIGAWTLLMGQIQHATEGASTQGITPLSRALEELKSTWLGTTGGAKGFLVAMGEEFNKTIASDIQLINALGQALNAIDRAPQWIGDHWERFKSGAKGVTLPQDRLDGAQERIGATIDSVGTRLGANNDVLALAHRIQPIESATGQYDAQGRVVQSSAGALGAMQVMPGSANGNDLRTTTGNVTAGVQLLMRLYAKYDGNQSLVAMAYNWGEGNVDQYLSGKIASPPSSVTEYAQKATGGEVYGAQAIASRQGRIDDQLRGSDGSTAAQIREHEQAITALTTAQKDLNELHIAGKVSDADYAAQTGVLTDKINIQRGAVNELRDPIQALAHQQTLAAQSAETYSAAEASMVQVHQQVEEAARRMGQEHATAAQIADAEARQQAILTGQFNQSVAAINLRTQAEQNLLAGYDASKGSLSQYQQAMEAAEKVRATSIDGTTEQARQLDILTGAMKSAAASQVDMANAGKLYAQSHELEIIQAQTAAIGQNSDAVSVQIAVMKERNRILEAGGDIRSKTSQAYLDNVAAIQIATNAYQHQKSVLDELTGSMESMFDTLTNSITQAFIQGGKGAASFSSILSGLQTQIVGMVTKLGLINPLMNALDGKGRNTFTNLSDALSTGGSIGNGAAQVSIPGAGTATGNAASSGNWLSGALKTKLFGGASIGNLLGGIGGGFGLGSALGNIGGGTYGMIGSGAGAAIGAGIGSFVPVIGTMLGGVVGGGLGGLFGGLFGHKKNPYTIDQVLLEGDQFKLGKTWNQKQTDNITAQLKAEIQSLNTMMANMGLKAENAYLGTVRDDPNNKNPDERSVSLKDLLGGVRLRSEGNATFSQALSQGLPASFDSVASFQSAVTQLKGMADTVDALGASVSKFNSDGTVSISGFTTATGDLRTALDHMLNGRTVATSDLQKQVQTITEFVSNTMPNLMKATVNGQQSWVAQMEALKKTYADAASQASSYGLDGNALNDKFSTLYREGYDQNMRSLAENAQSVRARLLTAQGDHEGADLANFDLAATQQTRQLANSWKGFLGEAYADNQTYLQQATDLEKTLAAERLSIQKQYADKAAEQARQQSEQARQQSEQAASSAASVISNLLDFSQGLSFSNYSPLSAEAQYRAANDNFSSLANRAQQGDYEALQSMRSAAETLLTKSQSYNGSGQDYVTDYTHVQKSIQSIGNTRPDVITQSALKAMLKDNNQTLAELLQRLVDTANKQLAEQRHQAQGRAA